MKLLTDKYKLEENFLKHLRLSSVGVAVTAPTSHDGDFDVSVTQA